MSSVTGGSVGTGGRGVAGPMCHAAGSSSGVAGAVRRHDIRLGCGSGAETRSAVLCPEDFKAALSAEAPRGRAGVRPENGDGDSAIGPSARKGVRPGAQWSVAAAPAALPAPCTGEAGGGSGGGAGRGGASRADLRRPLPEAAKKAESDAVAFSLLPPDSGREPTGDGIATWFARTSRGGAAAGPMRGEEAGARRLDASSGRFRLGSGSIPRGLRGFGPRGTVKWSAGESQMVSVEVSTKRKIAVQFCKISDESTAIWRFCHLRFGVRFV
eukprot:scaffold23437_cov75-Isochrysis_galbana.AAC.5